VWESLVFYVVVTVEEGCPVYIYFSVYLISQEPGESYCRGLKTTHMRIDALGEGAGGRWVVNAVISSTMGRGAPCSA
jgi:hypothetical protein